MKNKEYVQQLVGFYRPFWSPVTKSVVITFTTIILSIYLTTLFGDLIDNVTNFYAAINVIGLMLLIRVIRIFLSYINERNVDKNLAFRVQSHSSKISMDTMRKLSVGQFMGQDSGRIQSIVTNGESTIPRIMFTVLFTTLPLIVEIIVCLIALAIIDFKIGMVALLGCILYIIQTRVMTRYIRKKIKKVRKMSNHQSARFKEILDLSALIKTSSQEGRVSKEHAARYNRYNAYGEKMWLFWDNHNLLRDMSSNAVVLLVAFMSVCGIVTGEYAEGQIVVFWMLTARSVNNLRPLARMHRELLDLWSKIVDYIDILNLDPEVKNPENPINRPRIHGDIKISNVTFSYPKSGLFDILKRKKKKKIKKDDTEPKIVLNNLSLDIKAGEKVALVGKSGSGKSTLVQLLLRGYDPQRGAIMIDGYDLKSYDMTQYRNMVGVVEQNVKLFNTTLGQNILFSLPEDVDRNAILPESIMEVCEKAHITEFWDRLEERGLHTVVGENGVMLSGGQRQRVGIARALIKNPSILILDEATSNLDAQTERYIKEALDVASKGKTTIIIAHRLSTVKDADKIVVLDKGRIVGLGTHDELVDECDEYQELVKHQTW